jgi:uncharacterized membrane protein YgdD (TMEM256/DUF423 family)
VNSARTLAIAGLLLALATVFGAFGAHALKAQLSPDRLQVYETAVRYHFFHALGLLGIGLALRFMDVPSVRWAAVLMIAGIVLFSGSLYALTFGAPRPFGIVTPIGGVALIAGWICFAVGAWRATVT